MRSETGTPSSIADRLVRYSKAHKQDHSFVLARYGIERLLWRISNSDNADEFVLKGATLFVTSSRIREEKEYEGVRLRLLATLLRTRINLQVDVGFGDAVVPGPIKTDFPTLLDQPHPVLWTYPPETVVAEKLQAIVDLGIRTTRMKDFHDISTLLTSGRLSQPRLEASVKATFERRRTEIPTDVPFGLSEAFGKDPSKQRQWAAFMNRMNSGSSRPLGEVVKHLREQLMPVFQTLSPEGQVPKSDQMTNRGGAESPFG